MNPLVNAVLLFTSTFLLVFFLGLQSRNVNTHQYSAAFFTSFGIGATQLILYKLAPDAGVMEVIAYLMGGPFGIVTAMWFHARYWTSGGERRRKSTGAHPVRVVVHRNQESPTSSIKEQRT